MRYHIGYAVSGLLALMTFETRAAGQVFTGLGIAPGATSSYAGAVSADGTTVIGYSGLAFRWTRGGGLQLLGTLPGGTTSSAGAVNRDGSVIVGVAHDGTRNTIFRWTPRTGMQPLGNFDVPMYGSAVSSDGSIVAGYRHDAATYRDIAVVIGPSGIVQNLPEYPGYSNYHPHGVSDDGTVVMGNCDQTGRFFRWTAAGGMTVVPGASGRYYYGSGCSANRSIIVGDSYDSSFWHTAFSYSPQTGYVSLAFPPGGVSYFAFGVNADGTVIVGSSESQRRAVVWRGAGVVDLNIYLPSIGVDLTGWILTAANAVSADGNTIVGYGTHNGVTEGWAWGVNPQCGSADFNGDGDVGTDADIEAFFACLAGNCCAACYPFGADFNGDGDSGTDADIEAFFRVLGGGTC